MLGLGGFVLLAVSSAFGELEQAVETTRRWPGATAAESPRSRTDDGRCRFETCPRPVGR
jgi:hypothetical protein